MLYQTLLRIEDGSLVRFDEVRVLRELSRSVAFGGRLAIGNDDIGDLFKWQQKRR